MGRWFRNYRRFLNGPSGSRTGCAGNRNGLFPAGPVQQNATALRGKPPLFIRCLLDCGLAGRAVSRAKTLAEFCGGIGSGIDLLAPPSSLRHSGRSPSPASRS